MSKKVTEDKHFVLVCDCGDCTHWEIVKQNLNAIIDVHVHCCTCGKNIPALKLSTTSEVKWEVREGL